MEGHDPLGHAARDRRTEREPQGWVCRGRELKADDTFAELYALPGFPRGVSRADLSADGKLLTVDGGSPAGRAVKLFDGTTGKELVVPGFPPVGPAGFLRITPSGNRVLLYQDDRLTVIEMPGGKNLGTHAHPRQGVNDAGTHQADAENGVTVTRVGSAAVVLRLDPDADHTRNSENPFSRDGGAVAWGRPDGTVLVADLAEVLKRVGPFQTR